jgi:hypothetical protein
MGMPAASTAGGQCSGMPDTCKVPGPPPVPTPFPNLGQLELAQKTEMKVLIQNMPVIVESSEVPMSQGDEAGAAGGVVSGTIMGPIVFRTASAKVSFGGKKAVPLTATSAHNGSNANCPAGTLVAVSQQVVSVGM